MDVVQEDLNINVNTITQTVTCIVADYLLSEFVVSKVAGDKVDLKVSAAFHILDEVIFPKLVRRLRSILRGLPLIGRQASVWVRDISNLPFIKTVARIVVLMMLQRALTPGVDPVEIAIILGTTYAVNYGVEIKQIEDILSYEF
jgi:hypothetical protein